MKERLLILAAERITEYIDLNLAEATELVQDRKCHLEEYVACAHLDVTRDHFRARVADCVLWLAAAKELSERGEVTP